VRREKIKDGVVEFIDWPDVKEQVFERVLAWFMEHQCFTGEQIMQGDSPQLTSPELMCDLAEIIEFDPSHEEE